MRLWRGYRSHTLGPQCPKRHSYITYLTIFGTHLFAISCLAFSILYDYHFAQHVRYVFLHVHNELCPKTLLGIVVLCMFVVLHDICWLYIFVLYFDGCNFLLGLFLIHLRFSLAFCWVSVPSI